MSVLFGNVVDITGLNAYHLFIKLHPDYIPNRTDRRRLFLKELYKELVIPQMQARLESSNGLQKPVLDAMKHFGVQKIVPERSLVATRKHCFMCPHSADRKSKILCKNCHQNVCGEHSNVICNNCE